MYRRRVSILTAKSLRTLQVCRQPSCLESLKTITFSRNINTATQISDIDNSSGLNGETFSDFQQNPDGVLNYNSNGNDSSNKLSFKGQGWASNQHIPGRPQNLDGFYSGNSRRIEQNPAGVYGQNPRTEFQEPTSGGRSNFSQQGFQHNPYVQNENFSRSGSLPSSSSDFGSRNDNQKNLVEHNGSDSAYHGENSSISHNSRIEGGVEAQPSQNGVSGYYQHNSNGYYRGNSGMSQQNFSGHYPRNTGVSQQILANYYPGNEGNLQAGNFGMYPQSASGYDTGSQRSSSGYSRETVGQYQQNLSGFSNSQSQNGIVGPQEMGSLKHVEQSSDSSESSCAKGSIEELDSFCIEGKLKEAVEVLHLLEQQHVIVDLPRYLTLMNACGEDKSLEEAKSVHEHLVRSYPHLDVKTYNKILEMYAKCGSMDDASLVFEKMAQRNLTSWDTMITWLGKNGLGEDAVDLFAEFKKTGMKPDGQMFLGVFHACSVVGDIVEGMLHFESMNKDYGIVHSMDHYVGVVNMLGSTGYLDEAMEFIEKMPIEPSIEIWETMMILCRIHGNLELGDRCAEIVELLDPTRLDEQSKAGLLEVKASDIAKEKEKKKFAQSLLEARSRVHEYRAGDRSHPDHEKIYELLRGLKQLMKEAGYIPEVKFVLHDVDQETKEDALMAHSERLAFAQGLMNSSARSPIRIIKNLRVCGDCHNALKIASKLVGREIIMRDAKRFHHLKDGLCSCRDYW